MRDTEDTKRLKLVAEELQKELSRRLGRLIRLRTTLPLKPSYTNGWRVELGSLGQGEPRLEIWHCEWAGEKDQRRIWYGLYATQAEKLRKRVAALPEFLRPVRRLSEKDMRLATGSRSDHLLKKPLDPREYDCPIYEEYEEKGNDYAYYGMYDSALPVNEEQVLGIVTRATRFFEQVIKSQQPTVRSQEKAHEDDYAHIENRQMVQQHLARERSRALATQCHRRDNYRCQVCEITFREVYGDIGKSFAEAHHTVPLASLTDTVESSLHDLVTVCANCHRMLHKLDGGEEDLAKLRRMLHRR
ncbi:MAG: HNH endonuclease [Nitrospirae bacterium]|nr:HNH endonuclease [Nitrospirota bacterium]